MDTSSHAFEYRDQPLLLSVWLNEAATIRDDLNRARPSDAERLLRRCFYLSHLAPEPWWNVLSSPYSETAFERRLETGTVDRESAALINPILRLRTTRSRGLTAAVLTEPASGATASWESRSPALAVIGAWLTCSLGLYAINPDANPIRSLLARSESPSRPSTPTLM